MADAAPCAFEAIDNFRDFGGFSGRFGMVRMGRLFRSAHLARASAADLAVLSGLNLAAVIDLRRPTEREGAPNRLPDGFGGLALASDDGDRAQAPHIEFMLQGDLSDAAVERYLVGYYEQAPFEPRHRDLFARAFAVLARPGAAILVHCTAGKDRTGLLAALIRRALGAHDDDVLQDYLATNAATLTPARIVRAHKELLALTGFEPSLATIDGFLGVASRHLQAAFAAIDRRGGGLEPYLASLGVDSAAAERLRRNLIG